MNSIATTPAGVFRKITVRETAVLLIVAWLVPFLVHLIPWTGARPLGAYLLPMFWATFVAVYFYGAGVGLLTGLFGPAVNLFLTGLPAWKFLSVLSFELALFAVGLAWAVRHLPRFWLLAPLGYLGAKTASTLLQSVTPVFGDIGAPLRFFGSSVSGGAAGLVALAAINFALVRFYPKPASAA
ncbi:MAG: hypothetical protein JSR48_01805 [Verrucomicrobia bacterium]|nr:hypothetical protein [Verrucomicrobiota bacterium]